MTADDDNSINFEVLTCHVLLHTAGQNWTWRQGSTTQNCIKSSFIILDISEGITQKVQFNCPENRKTNRERNWTGNEMSVPLSSTALVRNRSCSDQYIASYAQDAQRKTCRSTSIRMCWHIWKLPNFRLHKNQFSWCLGATCKQTHMQR
jgi:hypothetical protein